MIVEYLGGTGSFARKGIMNHGHRSRKPSVAPLTNPCEHPPMPAPHAKQPFEWIFGYGSLMWRPGFEFVEQRRARLVGYRRALCMYSQHHRGTAAVPGLVLGLDGGGECQGIAFRILPADRERIVRYLDQRELVGYAYVPTVIEIEIGATRAAAYTFIADPMHAQYAGDLGIDRSAEIIMQAAGSSGLNRDYLINTVEKLDREGFADEALSRLLARVKHLTGEVDQGGGI